MSSSVELSPEWTVRLDKVRQATVVWRDWLEGTNVAEPSSPMFGDDRLHSKRPVYLYSRQGLVAGSEHLRLMIDGIDNVGYRPLGYFTLARTSLLAASRTVWILSPTERRKRQERALWAAFEDMRNLVKFVRDSPPDPTDPKAIAARDHVESEMDELKEVALQELGLNFRREDKPTETSVIEAAAEHLDPGNGGTARRITQLWCTQSGHAHGLSWPTLLRRPTSTFVGDDGRQYSKDEANPNEIVEAASAAMLMVNEAFTLYDQRATSHL
ncbi:hypothetical protein [Nocardia sp. MW-W600-9]